MFVDKYPYSDLHELNLDWIISQVKQLDVCLKEEIPELIERMEAVEYDVNIIKQWITDFDVQLLKNILTKYFKFAIFIEISNSGYIIFNIPESWDEITFNTSGKDIMIDDVNYGHLILSY